MFYLSVRPSIQLRFLYLLSWVGDKFFSSLYFLAFFFTFPFHTDTRLQPLLPPPPHHILLTRLHSRSSSLFWPLWISSLSLPALWWFRRVLIIFIQHFWVFYARRYCSLIKILERVLLLLSSPNISMDMVPFSWFGIFFFLFFAFQNFVLGSDLEGWGMGQATLTNLFRWVHVWSH